MNGFPKGYQIHVTTWENDADSYKTEILSGLTGEDVNFYVDLLKHFRSKNNHQSPGLGNGATKAEELLQLVNDTLAKHPDISETERLRWTEDVDESCIYEILTDTLLGHPDNEYYAYEYENFCRVFDTVKVYYFPQEVEDVTTKFVQ